MQLSTKNCDIVSSFVNSFAAESKAKAMLCLDHSEFGVFKQIKFGVVTRNSYKENPFPESGSWDLVLGDFPFGMPIRNSPLLKSGVPTYSSAAILKSLDFINDGGYGIFTSEPTALSSSGKVNIRKLLASTGFSLVGIINTPDGFFKPYTALRTPLLIVRKGDFDKEFIGELEDEAQASTLAESFFSGIEGLNLSTGMLVAPNNLRNFSQWKIQQQINALETEYKNFSSKKVGEIAEKINSCASGEIFKPIDNCIYLPKLGTQPVIADLDKAAIKHQNYFQIVCKADIVDAEYLAAFFESKIGRLIVDSLRSSSWIPSTNRGDLADADISLPPLENQREIVRSITKLKLIREKIGSFEDNLALNPISSDFALKQIDLMLDVVGELAEADKVKSIIRQGESKNVEFKESLSLDVKKQTKEKYIEDVVIKTIAAFLNTDGGVLLVGVTDAGVVNGVDGEIDKFHKNLDKFLLHFKNALKTRIGEQFYPFIDHRLVKVDSKHVLYVNCKESTDPVYVDGNDFYVRTNPATDKLDGPKMVSYINNHFKK
jgi:hypothetical protein